MNMKEKQWRTVEFFCLSREQCSAFFTCNFKTLA